MKIFTISPQLFIVLFVISLLFSCNTARKNVISGESSIGNIETKSEARTINIVARDHVFVPDEFTVKPGETISIVLTNEGDAEHNIVFNHDRKIRLKRNIATGESETLQFRAPEEEGSHEFYCSVGIHRQLGMKGNMHVRK